MQVNEKEVAEGAFVTCPDEQLMIGREVEMRDSTSNKKAITKISADTLIDSVQGLYNDLKQEVETPIFILSKKSLSIRHNIFSWTNNRQ